MGFIKYLANRFYNSTNYAIEGILHAAKTQAHIRFHLIATMFLLIFCFAFGIRQEEFIILSIVASIVIVAEMINSAIEETVDIASPFISDKAKAAKDVAAGAVLIAAAMSLVVAFYVIIPYIRYFYYNGLQIAKHTGGDVTIFSMIVVMILVIIIKAYFGHGHPLKGGLPSGHTSLAFSIWASLSIMFPNKWVIGIILIFAVAVGISRVVMKIHTVIEVVAGLMLGSCVTYLCFRFFYVRF